MKECQSCPFGDIISRETWCELLVGSVNAFDFNVFFNIKMAGAQFLECWEPIGPPLNIELKCCFQPESKLIPTKWWWSPGTPLSLRTLWRGWPQTSCITKYVINRKDIFCYIGKPQQEKKTLFIHNYTKSFSQGECGGELESWQRCRIAGYIFGPGQYVINIIVANRIISALIIIIVSITMIVISMCSCGDHLSLQYLFGCSWYHHHEKVFWAEYRFEPDILSCCWVFSVIKKLSIMSCGILLSFHIRDIPKNWSSCMPIM